MAGKKAYFSIVLLILCQQLFAQDTTGKRQEVWPEINLFYKLNNKFRLFGLYSATKLKNSSYTDGGYGICVDYFTIDWLRGKIDSHHGRDSIPGRYLWLRAGYLYSSTPEDAKDPVQENTLLSEANGRFHIGGDFLLTDKNRVDWRFVNGDFKPRYRNKLTIEKDMHTDYLFFTPYIYGEIFVNMYDGGAVSDRLRLCAGSELRVAKHINFEMYFLYQFDNGKDVQALSAAGFVLKLYFDHKEIKQKFKKKKRDKES